MSTIKEGLPLAKNLTYTDTMLKPLKPKTDSSPSKPAQIVVSIIDGKQVYSDADTGKIITLDQNRFTPSFEPFNSEKASILISALAQDYKLIEALEHASVSKATFSTWLMTNEEFSQAVDKARATRAQLVHEKFHAITKDELLSDIPDDEEDLKLHAKKLSIIERRQKILKLQKIEDNPNRFSDKEQNQSMAASVAISIDPEIITKMQAKYTSNLTPDGELDTNDSTKKLQDILDADFKELPNE